jgi:hypothetical protein
MSGREAIWPLLIMAAGKHPFPAQTPLKGLSFVALQYRCEVCAAMAGTLSAKTLVHEKSLEPIKDFQRSLSCCAKKSVMRTPGCCCAGGAGTRQGAHEPLRVCPSADNSRLPVR